MNEQIKLVWVKPASLRLLESEVCVGVAGRQGEQRQRRETGAGLWSPKGLNRKWHGRLALYSDCSGNSLEDEPKGERGLPW